MANGAFNFKNNSGNIVSFISGSDSNIIMSGGTLDLSSMTGITLGNLTLSGTTQNATSASHAASYLLTSSFNTYSGNTNTVIGTLQTSTSSLNSFTSSATTRLSSIETTTGSLNSYTSSNTTNINAIHTSTSSLNSFTSSATTRLSSIESKTGSYATTGSNTFRSSQTITGSLFISENLVIAGSSSIQYISSSVVNIDDNIITVNAMNPSVRFGGLAVIDSGSSPQVSGSMLFDSVNNQWVFVHQNQTSVTSSVLLMGPETYDNLGNETYLTLNRLPKGTGIEHLVNSNITDTGTKVSINSNTEVTGTFVATGALSGTSATFTSFTQASNFISDGSQFFSFTLKGRSSDNFGAIGFYNNNGSTRVGYIQSGTINGGQVNITGDGGGSITLDNRGITATGVSTFSSTLSATQYTAQSDSAYYRVRRASGTDVGYITDSTTWGSTGTDFSIGASSANLRFFTNNSITEHMRLDSSGRLGIGTSTPGTRLEILSRAADADRTVPHNVLTITATQGNAPYGFFGGAILFKNSSYVTGVVESSRIRSVIYDDGAPNNFGGGLWFETTATPGGALTPSLVLNYQGRVGINNTTPITQLDVRLSATDNVNGSVANSYPVASFIVNGSGGGQRGIQLGGPVGSISSPTFLKIFGTSARFSIINQSNVENLTVLENGRVGIGLTDPQDRLDVNGSIRFRANTPNFTAAIDNGVMDYVPTSIDSSFPRVRIAAIGTASVGGEIRFLTGTPTSIDNRMTITSGGFVGVGLTSPVVRLDVNGNIKNTARVFSGNAVTGNIAPNFDPGFTRNYILICDLNDIAGFSLSGFMNAASYTCWNISSFFIMKNYSSTTATAGITGQFKAGGCDMNIVDLSYGGGRYIAIGYTSNPEIDVIWTGYRITHMLNADGSAQVIPQSNVTVNSTLASF